MKQPKFKFGDPVQEKGVNRGAPMFHVYSIERQESGAYLYRDENHNWMLEDDIELYQAKLSIVEAVMRFKETLKELGFKDTFSLDLCESAYLSLRMEAAARFEPRIEHGMAINPVPTSVFLCGISITSEEFKENCVRRRLFNSRVL